MLKILTNFFGDRNGRVLKKLYPALARINAFSDVTAKLDDAALQAKTTEFRTRIEQGESLDDLLPEAFAVVREASDRVLSMRHFDAQLLGGVILHQGKIAEMKTGEGKTLTATLAIYLNALSGKGAHVVTVNDYLASRDAEQMGQLYGFLGLTTGVIVSGMEHAARQAAYAADITYGTNNEFGFDYLRDNMAFSLAELVQRGYNFAIVDEVDSILIDEARTPLIISGPTEQAGELYTLGDKLARKLVPEDYDLDEKDKVVSFTESGMEHIEDLFREVGHLTDGSGLYDPENINLLHAATQSLRAHTLFMREKEYIVRNDEVVIIDEFTVRMMAGRRYSDGQHQALEAKEGVTIQAENQTLSSITFQNFFRLYGVLSGMTGTADTEAEEFNKIYKLEVVILPTNRDMVRHDMGDLIYRDAEDKYDAIIEDIVGTHATGAPVLVGTTSIDKSEFLADLLKKKGIPHEVLNAKHHEREADIVGQAGRKNAITIATNMAGRGTDIVLGGNPDMLIAALPKKLSDNERAKRAAEIKEACKVEHEEVVAAGGLHIIGTERHESRRIDNQLRGRAGRQGDPGSTRFYLSLEDDLMRIFGGDKMQNMLTKMGFSKGEVIEHPWVSKAISNSQKKVEGRNFDTRKQLLEYDDVMNKQREVIYNQRRDVLEAEDVQDVMQDMALDYADRLIETYLNDIPDAWDVDGLQQDMADKLGIDADVQAWVDADDVETNAQMTPKIVQAMTEHMAVKEEQTGDGQLRGFEKWLLLHVLDQHWKEHLLAMDHLRQSVGLRGYAQKNPVQEYKHESFKLFSGMLDKVRVEAVTTLFRVEVKEPPKPEPKPENIQYNRVDNTPAEKVETFKRDQPKVGRNDPCPCGSGKKYKQCHGKKR
ncbi:MAG: preprotein translocase subunit SecA [Mariprofundaceae bacterium]|nr:preprotein translocase subunit SecA [Mariprofundaceae bacterium]